MTINDNNNSKFTLLKGSNEAELAKKRSYLSKIASFCDKCGTKYAEQDLTIISDDGTQAIIHFKCANCLSEHIANYIDSVGATSRMPIVTDMRAEEFGKFIFGGSVTSDNVIDVYAKLRGKK